MIDRSRMKELDEIVKEAHALLIDKGLTIMEAMYVAQELRSKVDRPGEIKRRQYMEATKLE